jgi:hypothetical protein
VEYFALTLTYVVMPLTAALVLRLTPRCAPRDRFTLYVMGAALMLMSVICAVNL